MIDVICDWCGWLDDPARDQPCPCRANTATAAQVAHRHRVAVRLARRHGWAGNARDRRLPVLVTDPTGRGWAA